MEYLLKRISTLNHVGISYYNEEENQFHFLEGHEEYNPIAQSDTLKKIMLKGAMAQEEPYIYVDKYTVYFACIRREHLFYFVGPMSLRLLDRVELHQYYRYYGMNDSSEKRLVHFTFADMLDLVEVVSNILIQKEYSDDELIYANQIVKETKKQEEHEQLLFDLREGEEEIYHHTYQEERKLLDCVKEGQVEDAVRLCRNMDSDLGKLSSKELEHWEKVATVAITLCTRAAIEGGVSPSIAYRISDFYIQKSNTCKDIASIIKCRDRAVQAQTEQVQKKQSRKSSSYVERCKDYVDKNYKRKIYLGDIADNLGISETYLSRLFKKETGTRLQDFIVDVRLDRAANLLKFSDESISNIAEYVNFPSQSYMGKAFKAKFGITPKQYREKNRPSEFFEE